MNQSKTKLIRFLDSRVFNPILRTAAGNYSASEKKALDRLKRKTEQLKERYRTYRSAGQVRQEFEDDLTSQAAKRVNADLKRLRLPSLPSIKHEFLNLADSMGVTRERGERRPHRPHPPHPWHKKKPQARAQAWRELRREARRGSKAAQQTLRKAEAKRARKK